MDKLNGFRYLDEFEFSNALKVFLVLSVFIGSCKSSPEVLDDGPLIMDYEDAISEKEIEFYDENEAKEIEEIVSSVDMYVNVCLSHILRDDLEDKWIKDDNLELTEEVCRIYGVLNKIQTWPYYSGKLQYLNRYGQSDLEFEVDRQKRNLERIKMRLDEIVEAEVEGLSGFRSYGLELSPRQRWFLDLMIEKGYVVKAKRIYMLFELRKKAELISFKIAG